MTKARGAADSIGKAGRGASFLLPAFSPYYVPYFPLFLRARAHTNTRPHPYIYAGPNTHIYPRSLSFLSSPSSPSSSCPILLHPSRRSLLLLPLLIVPRCLRPLRRYCTYVYTRARAYVCVRAPCLNRRTRGFMSHGSTLPRREGGFVRG